MKYTYTKQELKEYLLAGALDNLLEDGKFIALIVERKVSHDNGHTFMDTVGYDDTCSKGVRYETKYTGKIQVGRTLRINSAGENKKGGFDFIRIVDGVNQRIFEIPHDEYFTKGGFEPTNQFRWSSSYNKSDKVKRSNTTLLLQYEVTQK
jgi:hypothetical protein